MRRKISKMTIGMRRPLIDGTSYYTYLISSRMRFTKICRKIVLGTVKVILDLSFRIFRIMF